MKLTAKRRAWLKRLLLGPAHRTSRTGFDTMQAGWTEWNYHDASGNPISLAEAKERWGLPGLWSHITSDGERITDLGRKVLMEDDKIEHIHDRMAKVDQVLDAVRAEIGRAVARYPVFNSHHEGYAVLLEEVDELWDEVKTNNHGKAKAEALQVAAMAIRFITDLEG